MRLLLSAVLLALPILADDGDSLLTIDHYVRVRSQAPSIAGQMTQLYVREVVRAGTVAREKSLANRVVLFVHGAGTPAEVAFDAPTQDYSWMKFLARAGFDVFSMDVTGYGRSTRPPAMNDPCNLSKQQQATFGEPCSAPDTNRVTTIESDWYDIGAVVDYLRAARRVDRIHMIGWSLGGPRAGGYAAQHPEKVSKLVLLAPAYNRNPGTNTPGAPFNTQSREDFNANWKRQVTCGDRQYDADVEEAVWSAMLESDPIGATWGTGVRRAPNVAWAWPTAVVSKMQTPALLIAGASDVQVLPARVRDLYDDYGAKEKVMVDLACSSHNALWEKNHLLMYNASLEWLSKGAVSGASQGVVKLGY